MHHGYSKISTNPRKRNSNESSKADDCFVPEWSRKSRLPKLVRSGIEERDLAEMFQDILKADRDALLLNKQKYPVLDELIKDETFLDKVGEEQTGDTRTHLTLVTALRFVNDPPPLPSAGVIRSLEENLSIFVPSMSKKQKSTLAANLLNGSCQFLNTLSELALARHYHDRGWKTKLAYQLSPDKKDVDLFVEKDGQSHAIEVLNAAPSECEVNGFAPVLPSDFQFRLMDKIVQKYDKKFSHAIKKGWNGNAWIALDITKNDGVAVGVTISSDERLREFACEALRQCKQLSGVMYFTYCAAKPTIHWRRAFSQEDFK